MKTASPEMLALAPKDLPEKMGPFYKKAMSVVIVRSDKFVLTLMVKVALSVEISVDFRRGEGILRSVLDWTVAR